MNYLGFAFNFNIQRCEIDVGAEDRIVEKGYRPLITLLADRHVPSCFYISGYSTELIWKHDPDLIELIKSRKGMEFALGTYTYTHPIPQMLSPQEMIRQIRRGMETDSRFYGAKPKGFFPPEFACTRALSLLLSDCGINYTIVLSDFLARAHPEYPIKELFIPYGMDIGRDRNLIAVPITLDLPDGEARFFKRMLLGELTPEKAMDGLERFLDSQDSVFVIIERDAETLFIDEFNSGITGTVQRLEKFLNLIIKKIPALNTSLITIDRYLENHKPGKKAALGDFLGNTKIETFTDGPSRELWEKTLVLRNQLLALKEDVLPPEGRKLAEEAWEHMLLSHNSDGRIGYWYSAWKPGEHTAVASRRQFVEDHLARVESLLIKLGNLA